MPPLRGRAFVLAFLLASGGTGQRVLEGCTEAGVRAAVGCVAYAADAAGCECLLSRSADAFTQPALSGCCVRDAVSGGCTTLAALRQLCVAGGPTRAPSTFPTCAVADIPRGTYTLQSTCAARDAALVGEECGLLGPAGQRCQTARCGFDLAWVVTTVSVCSGCPAAALDATGADVVGQNAQCSAASTPDDTTCLFSCGSPTGVRGVSVTCAGGRWSQSRVCDSAAPPTPLVVPPVPGGTPSCTGVVCSGSACKEAQCNPATGRCDLNKPTGTGCGDGRVCASGACVAAPSDADDDDDGLAWWIPLTIGLVVLCCLCVGCIIAYCRSSGGSTGQPGQGPQQHYEQIHRPNAVPPTAPGSPHSLHERHADVPPGTPLGGVHPRTGQPRSPRPRTVPTATEDVTFPTRGAEPGMIVARGLPHDELTLAGVEPHSPAEVAGLTGFVGREIVHVNGQRVLTPDQFFHEVQKTRGTQTGAITMGFAPPGIVSEDGKLMPGTAVVIHSLPPEDTRQLNNQKGVVERAVGKAVDVTLKNGACVTVPVSHAAVLSGESAGRPDVQHTPKHGNGARSLALSDAALEIGSALALAPPVVNDVYIPNPNTADLGLRLYPHPQCGLVLYDVRPGSPADCGKLERHFGRRLIGVNDSAVRSIEQARQHAAGTTQPKLSFAPEQRVDRADGELLDVQGFVTKHGQGALAAWNDAERITDAIDFRAIGDEIRQNIALEKERVGGASPLVAPAPGGRGRGRGLVGRDVSPPRRFRDLPFPSALPPPASDAGKEPYVTRPYPSPLPDGGYSVAFEPRQLYGYDDDGEAIDTVPPPTFAAHASPHPG